MKINRNHERETSEDRRMLRLLSAVEGFGVASLFGVIGILASVILWAAGTPALFILLAYFCVPAVMIGLFYLAWRRR